MAEMIPLKDSTTPVDILIVDDTHVDRRLLAHMCGRQGYTVGEAADGASALELVHLSQPDLILLDIRMEEIDGYEVCRRLKADVQVRDIPVIFISSLDATVDRVEAFAAGGADYIQKPFHVAETLARINHHLTLRRLQNELQAINDELEQRVEARTAQLLTLNRELEALAEAANRFVPREFLDFLGKRQITEVGLGDQVERNLTIMFADIRDFANMSEQMTPDQSFAFINKYLSQVGPIIRARDGIIDKYVGDGVMALFAGRTGGALAAAIDIQRAVRALSQERIQLGHSAFRIGISLHTGDTMVGIIGEEARLQGTVISDAVNAASRLERATKRYGANILLSRQTLEQMDAPETFVCRFIGHVQVEGRTETVAAYEALDGDAPRIAELKKATLNQFGQGVRHFSEGRFSAAQRAFADVLAVNADDAAARHYLQRIEFRNRGASAPTPKGN